MSVVPLRTLYSGEGEGEKEWTKKEKEYIPTSTSQ